MILVLAGPPGSGKGTQSRLLAQRHNLKTLSVGQALRQVALHDARLKERMERGELAPSEQAIGVVSPFLSQLHGASAILDGFPRNQDDAEWLRRWLDRHPDQTAKVICLSVPASDSQARLSVRGRPDDTPASRAYRQALYETETLPALKTLTDKLPFYEVDGVGSVEVVYERIITTGVLNANPN